MPLATTATPAAAIPFAEAFEKTFSSLHSWLQTPRNRALLESAWRTPDNELKAICDCFEWAGDEGWEREDGELEQLVWDAFIESENSDYGSRIKMFAFFAGSKRPGDVTENGEEIQD